ncbi:hypothetical protein KU306_17345 (plasmid) [Haloferax larsenii]|uniref:PH domain-containing protein n=1 Tax=Haloferax larsenii TaxID=302484 RepID=A0ABY5RIU2_HALLR|nr:hypothetical protein [Haloferax larsenii]UVE52074.1 hypothetical protein KU306_17345 [Haloferax larsenii]
MIRLFPKIRTKIKRVHKRLGPIFPILVTALVTALLTWGIGRLFDLFHLAPSIAINGIFSGKTLWVIDRPEVTFIAAFIFGALLGTWYFAYRPNRETVREHWEQIPTWGQATTLGLGGAIVVVLCLLVARHYWAISDLTVLAAFLVSWPLATGAVILANRRIDDCPRSTSIKIGYMHARGLESRTMAIVVGALFAVASGFVTWALSTRFTESDSALPAVTVAVLLWMLVTVFVYNRYEAQTTEQSGLSITSVNRPDTRTAWELTIRNESNETIDLSLAKIRDTKFDLYQFGVDTDLGPGALCTFNAPEEFQLEPNDDSWELPLGYTLKQGSETPVILTRTGEIYALQRDKFDGTDIDSILSEGADEDVTGTGQPTSSGGQSPGTNPSTQD